MGAFAVVLLVGFFSFVAVEAEFPDPHDPYSLKYYGGHTPGPSEYKEKLGEWDYVWINKFANVFFVLNKFYMLYVLDIIATIII